MSTYRNVYQRPDGSKYIGGVQFTDRTYAEDRGNANNEKPGVGVTIATYISTHEEPLNLEGVDPDQGVLAVADEGGRVEVNMLGIAALAGATRV